MSEALFCKDCWAFFGFNGSFVCPYCDEEVAGCEPVEVSYHEYRKLRREQKATERCVAAATLDEKD